MADESQLGEVEATGDNCQVDHLETSIDNLEKEIDAFWQDEGLDMFATPTPDENSRDDFEELWGQEELSSVEVENLEMISDKEVREDDIVCEYARSFRSSCKICGNKIEKNVLRFGKIMELQSKSHQNILSPLLVTSSLLFQFKGGIQRQSLSKRS